MKVNSRILTLKINQQQITAVDREEINKSLCKQKQKQRLKCKEIFLIRKSFLLPAINIWGR